MPEKTLRERMLPYGRQVIDESDVAAVVEVLRSDWLTTGPAVAEFEESLARRVGAAHAVAVSNGTAALHAAAAALGIGPGDEVIVPVMTFAASANCVRYQGGTVVFCDVRPDTLTIDVEAAERAVTTRTKAIVAVDYTGLPCDYDDLQTLARRHRLSIIDDAAHALGATYGGRKVGSITDVATFSFHPVKHITTGEGGAITTDDEALARRMRQFRSHGITTDARRREETGSWQYDMVDLGFNYRITDFQCALGASQLKRLDDSLTRRRQIAARYTAAFRETDEIVVPASPAGRESAWHLYVVRLALERLRCTRAEAYSALRSRNIGVNVHYMPVPWHSYYQKLGYGKGHWPVAEAAYERMLTLPLWSGMSDRDVDDVIDAVRDVVDQFRR